MLGEVTVRWWRRTTTQLPGRRPAWSRTGDCEINQPFVMGFLWNGGIEPSVKGAARQQAVRAIRTVKGKQLLLDDSQSGQLTLIDEKQKTISRSILPVLQTAPGERVIRLPYQ